MSTELQDLKAFMTWAQTMGGVDQVMACNVHPPDESGFCKVEVGMRGDLISIRGVRVETYHRYFYDRVTHTEPLYSQTWKNVSLGIPPIILKGAQTTICTFMIEASMLSKLKELNDE